MQKIRKRKKIRQLALIFVFVLLITGCSSKKNSADISANNQESNKTSSLENSKNTKENDTSSQNIKGRYVENSLPLPDDFGKYYNFQLTKKDGLPFLYVANYDDKLTFSGYRMNEDGTWTKDTPKWLTSVSINPNGNNKEIIDCVNGSHYLYYDEFENTSFKGKLLCSTDGTTYKELKPEGWEDKNSPIKVNVLEDGTLVAVFEDGEVDIYDKDSLKVKYSITGTKYSRNILSYYNHSLVLGQIDENEKIIGIDIYDMSDNYKKTSYPIQSTLAGNSYLTMNDKNDLILCTPDGVHILESGTSLWQTIIDGTLTSLNLPTLFSAGFIMGSAGEYYILYRSDNDNNYSLMKYTYDKTVNSIPSTELTIYSLKDHPILRQTAVLFQQKHPDVKVNFSIAMTDEEYDSADETIKNDYVRALNTELLAGGGTDLLVLNGLPEDSFVEKGVLSDMSDTIKPMIDNGELLSNIMNNYVQDGKIYYVPLSFYMQMIVGKDANIEKLSTLETFADYAGNHTDTSLLGALTPKDLITNLSPFLTNKVLDEEGNINREQLISVLNDLKVISDNSGIIDEYSEDYIPMQNRYGKLFDNVSICINPLNTFLQTVFELGAVTQLKGSYTSFENSFTSNLEIGINNTSSKKDLCKEFIALALSEEVQNNDYFDGFSVTKKGLKACSLIDRSNFGVGVHDKDGNSIDVKQASKKELENFVNLGMTVSNRAVGDEQITAAFKDEIGEFLNGNLSVEETAENIINKTQIYLSE